MLGAYVATIGPSGLESFLPEDTETIAKVAMRAFEGREERRACFWATVSDEVAGQVRAQLRSGRRLQALATLSADAFEIAPLCPWRELFAATQGYAWETV